MKFPATSDELKRKGYEYDNEATCKRCGERIEWWIDPSGRKAPMSILPPTNILKSNEEKRRPHFVDLQAVNQDFNEFVQGVAGGVLAFVAAILVLGVISLIVSGIRSAVRKWLKRRKRKWLAKQLS